jgi:hypothetical protein
MPYRCHERLRLSRERLAVHSREMLGEAVRFLMSLPHDGPVDPPFARHDAWRIWRPTPSATVVVGVDMATGRFVKAEQVDGSMRLVSSGEVRFDPGQLQAVAQAVDDDHVRARQDFWAGVSAPVTPWNPGGYVDQAMRYGLVDLEEPVFRARPLPGQDLKVSRMVYEGPPVDKHQFTSSGPILPIAQICSMGDNPLEYGRTVGGKPCDELSPEVRAVLEMPIREFRQTRPDQPIREKWVHETTMEVPGDRDAGSSTETAPGAGEPDASGGS